MAGNCGLQFTDNLGTAVAKGFDLQADADLGAGFTLEFSAGYTGRALHQGFAGRPRASPAMRSRAKAAINYAPARVLRGRLRRARSTPSKPSQHDAFVRLDWEYTSRNPWLAPVQDPRTAPV